MGLSAVRKLRPADVEAVEKLLTRLPRMNEEAREAVFSAVLPPLTLRMGVDPPEPKDRVRFFEDLLVTVYCDRTRNLG